MCPTYELGSVIADFLGAAEAGRARTANGRPYTPSELRALRSALAHASTELGTFDVAGLRARDVRDLVDELGRSGLSSDRASEIVDALRSVYAFAVDRGLVTTSPLVGLVPAAREGPSPTTAVVELGEHLARFAVGLMVVLFVLAAVGLAVAVV